MKAKKVALNLCYTFGDSGVRVNTTENFGEISLEAASNAFVIYVTYMQIDLRVYVNFLKCITRLFGPAYFGEGTGIVLLKTEKRFVKKKLFFLYIGCDKNFLKYLNISLKNPAFEYIFLNSLPGSDYVDVSLKILNGKS